MVIAFRYYPDMTGRDVKRVRESLGLSQRQFAERLGVHKVTVAKWEVGLQGMRGPAERLIQLLATPAGRVGKERKRPRQRSKAKRPKSRR